MESEMTLKLGSNLAFNDLPSSITADFTLTNARSWGLQEIAAKFNAGSLRVSNGLKDQNSLKPGEVLANGKTEDGELYNKSGLGTASNSGTASVAGNSAQSSASNVKNPAEQKPTIDSVPVVATGPLTEADAKAAALKKDAPVGPGSIPTTNPIPYNPTATIASVNNAGTSATNTVTTAAGSVVSNATAAVPVPSALSTKKEGDAGEQIVKDATSTIPVSVQEIKLPDFSRIGI
jgi:hypothetical protein